MAGQDDKDAPRPKGVKQARSASSTAAADVRAERLAAALRENLRRRKVQARGRQLDATGQSDAGQNAGQADVASEPVDNGSI
ncbi:MAG: hypothetical protein Q8M31_08255 [Beijerinckiaceae bacterium]|nr:hypothetical protein [Beijerinckiaceae bacterium]